MSPICDENRIVLIRWTIEDVLAIHKRHGIPLNPLYQAGAERVGCWPCLFSKKREIRNIALKFPERIDQIEAEEDKLGSTFFTPKKVPDRFRSKSVVTKDGKTVKVATIRDVVKWSLTGNRTKGSWEDDKTEDHPCQSGFCE